MQGGDPRIPMSRGCYSSRHFILMPWVSIPSLPLAGGAGTAPAPGDSPEPQKTPQLGVGAGKGPAWMCNHLLASLPVGFGDSHRLLCSLSRARHAWALSHPAPRVGFCPDISFSGGSWAFTAGAVVLWHMEGGSSARALAADRYKRYHCRKPPAAPSTSRAPQLCSRAWGGLGHPRGWQQQALCWQHPQTHPLPSCLNAPNAGLHLGGLRATSLWQGCVLLLLLVAFPCTAYRLTPPTRQICRFASQRKLPKPLVSSSRHPAGEPTDTERLLTRAGLWWLGLGWAIY